MDLIDRYLHAVRTWLPEKLHGDYLPELEEDLRAQVEDREAELGHPASQADVAEILKGSGHPILVATRLLPEQHLIGPAWFPIYRVTLRAVILWMLTPLYILILAPLAAIASANPFEAYLNAAFQLVPASLYSAGVITLAMAGLERLQLKIHPFEKWNPETLPAASPLRQPERFSRTAAIVEMGGGMLFLLWWVGVIGQPAMPGLRIELAEVWTAVFWPVIGIVSLSTFISTLKLLRPYWSPWFSILNLTLQTGTIVMIATLLKSAPLVSVGIQNASVEKLYRVNSIVDNAVLVTLIGCAIVAAFHLAGDVRRLMKAGSQPGCWRSGEMRPIER